MTNQERNRYKVKQLILYIATKMEDAPRFGSVKLNKVLYRADHEAYRQLGRKLTTYNYRKQELGPTLDAYVHVLGEMERDEQIEFVAQPAGRQTEQRPMARTTPDPNVFSAAELAIIDSEIERAWNTTGRGVTAEEHGTAAWYATGMGELIDPDLFLVEDPRVMIPLSDAEEEHAQAVLQRYLAGARAT
jgi:hypothetical protein